MKTREYKCCNCKTVFSGTCFNWYAYYAERKFHNCPECDSKLVETYDFERAGVLDKITVRLFIFSVVAGLIASYFWGWQLVGVLAFGVPAAVGGITHAMYWSVLSKMEDKEIQETRIFTN